MRYLEYSDKLARLKSIIESGEQGSPFMLANKLGLSERTLLRMVQQLRDQGYPVVYNRKGNRYERKVK